MQDEFEFRLLGPVELWHAGQRVSLGPPRQRCVAAVLLTEANRSVSTGALIARVWGEHPPKAARSALYSYIAHIKAIVRHLDPDGRQAELARTSGGYVLHIDPNLVDVHRFDRLVEQARALDDLDQAAAVWAAALRLWRGEPYQDLASEWVDHIRHTLQQRRLAAIWERNRVELDRGQHAELLAELDDLCRQHPLDERLTGQLMLACYRSGRQVEALNHYHTVRHRLADELGVDPAADLSGLYEQILHNDPALTAPFHQQPTAPSPGPAESADVARDRQPPNTSGSADHESQRQNATTLIGPSVVPRQLPVAVGDFTGREPVLARLDDLLSGDVDEPGAVVITAIAGTAGVGKTALAVHWAHRIADRFDDGQLYVNLRGFDPAAQPMRPAAAVRTLLDAFGVPPDRIPPELDAQVGLYRSILAEKRVLIVLDNARDADQVRPLLPASPGSLVIITSRNRLVGLTAIERAHPIVLDVLTEGEAHRFLNRRLGAERTHTEPAATAAIIDACARLPLALAIVAARAQNAPRIRLAAFAAELSEASGSLDVLDGGDPASDMRAVFCCSYRALSDDAAGLFRLLGLHPGPDISAAAAASLAGIPPSTARRRLSELAQAHLVTETTPGRYAFHDLLRAYATELTTEHDTETDRRDAVHRLLDHYLHTAFRAEQIIDPSRDPITVSPVRHGVTPEQLHGHEETMDWLATERHVLLAAVDHAAQHGFDAHCWQLAWTLNAYLQRRGHWHDRVAIWQTALTATGTLDDPGAQAIAHRQLAHARLRLHRFDGAQALLQHSLDLYAQLGDQDGQAHTHQVLSELFAEQDRYADALHHSRCAIDLYRSTGNRRGLATALTPVGWLHAMFGEFQQGLIVTQESLALHQAVGNRDGEAASWQVLGIIHHHLGHHQHAAASYQHALDLYHDIGDLRLQAKTLTHLGNTQHATGDSTAARHTWQQALTILDNLHHPDANMIRTKLALH